MSAMGRFRTLKPVLLRRSGVIKVMDRVTGEVFIAFGAKLAFSR